jgi:hypothetical protein
MAVIEIGNTKQAGRLINYCKNKTQDAGERDGHNVDPDRAQAQMLATRQMWQKNDGIQAHHVIQSFAPGEIKDTCVANRIGRELAEKIAPGFQVAIYTHSDKEHIHNHLVINSVHPETGKKYHSDRGQLFRIREKNDELCQERGLSIIEKPYAKERLTMAEYKLTERGQPLWKDELRTSIDAAKEKTSSLQEMKSFLKKTYGIEMKIQEKNVSFLHPGKQKYCRGKTLGWSYTKEAIENDYRERASQTRTIEHGEQRRNDIRERIHFREVDGSLGSHQQRTDNYPQRNRAGHEPTARLSRGGEQGRERAVEFGAELEKSTGRSQDRPERDEAAKRVERDGIHASEPGYGGKVGGNYPEFGTRKDAERKTADERNTSEDYRHSDVEHPRRDSYVSSVPTPASVVNQTWKGLIRAIEREHAQAELQAERTRMIIAKKEDLLKKLPEKAKEKIRNRLNSEKEFGPER